MSTPIETPTRTRPHPGKSALIAEIQKPQQQSPPEAELITPSPEASDEPTLLRHRRSTRDQE